MIEVCAIASGSNGNCYYVGNGSEAILIDAGVSCKQILERIAQRGLDASKIKGIFISHEHVDHIRGTRVLCKKLNIPAFFTYGTFNNAHKSSKPTHYKYVHINQPFQLGGLVVYPFAKRHDANEPCSFRVEIEGKSIGVMTDIGSVCDNVISHFKQCDLIFLEANYDEDMLWKGSYPWSLKQRIASDVGHLSNTQALQLVIEHSGGSPLKTIILSHLSGENNTPEIAYNAFATLHQSHVVLKTSRHEASMVISVE